MRLNTKHRKSRRKRWGLLHPNRGDVRQETIANYTPIGVIATGQFAQYHPMGCRGVVTAADRLDLITPQILTVMTVRPGQGQDRDLTFVKFIPIPVKGQVRVNIALTFVISGDFRPDLWL